MRCIFIYPFLAALFVIGCGVQQLPEVVISQPLDSTSVKGITTVLIVADEYEAVDSVVLFIDGNFTRGYSEPPFLYSWNTHVIDDNTDHFLCARAYDNDGNEGASDTVYVTVDNGSLLFGDDFESYVVGYTPEPIWKEIWPGVIESTYVSQVTSHEGVKSYHSFGYAAYVRTDGVGIDTTDVVYLAYEISVMVPHGSTNGALAGLFHRIDPETGEIYNGVMFSPADHHVHVRGISPVVTSFVWASEIWYDVRVELDFAQEFMNVWIDTFLIAENVETLCSTLTDTFAVSTIHGYDGGVYYDEVRVFKE